MVLRLLLWIRALHADNHTQTTPAFQSSIRLVEQVTHRFDRVQPTVRPGAWECLYCVLPGHETQKATSKSTDKLYPLLWQAHNLLICTNRCCYWWMRLHLFVVGGGVTLHSWVTVVISNNTEFFLLLKLCIPVQLICDLEKLIYNFFNMRIISFTSCSTEVHGADVHVRVLCSDPLDYISSGENKPQSG